MPYDADHERARRYAIFRELNEIDRRLHALSRMLEHAEARLARFSAELARLSEVLVGPEPVSSATRLDQPHLSRGTASPRQRRPRGSAAASARPAA